MGPSSWRAVRVGLLVSAISIGVGVCDERAPTVPAPRESAEIRAIDDDTDEAPSGGVQFLICDVGQGILLERPKSGASVPMAGVAATATVFAYSPGYDLGRYDRQSGGTPVIRLKRSTRSVEIGLSGDEAADSTTGSLGIELERVVALPLSLKTAEGEAADVAFAGEPIPAGAPGRVLACNGAATFVRAYSEHVVVWPHWTRIGAASKYIIRYRGTLSLTLEMPGAGELGEIARPIIVPDFLSSWDADPEEINAVGFWTMSAGEFPWSYSRGRIRLSSVPAMPASMLVLASNGMVHLRMLADGTVSGESCVWVPTDGNVTVDGSPASAGSVVLPGRLDFLAARTIVARARAEGAHLPVVQESGELTSGGWFICNGDVTVLASDGGVAFGSASNGEILAASERGVVRLTAGPRRTVQPIDVAVWPRWPQLERGAEIPPLEFVTRSASPVDGGWELSGLPLGAYCVRVLSTGDDVGRVDLARGLSKFVLTESVPTATVELAE